MQRQTPFSRLNPSWMVRGMNISTKLSSNSDMARLQNTPRQNVTSMVSSQKHLVRSSQVNLPRSVSVKKYYTDGSQEVTVESSVSVSLQFMRDASRIKEVDDNLEEIHENTHQLVCCTCMLYSPRMLVGECGCLACMNCLETTKHRYCNACQVSARYIPLEKLIMVSKDGSLGKTFMDSNVKMNVCMKEFLSKIVKEERDFKIARKILDKQEAALERRNHFEKEEMKKILDEEKTLQQKILTKYEAISKLEEALRLKHPRALKAEEYNKVGQERLEVNGNNSYFFSGEPSADVDVAKGFGDIKDQDHRNKNSGNEQPSKSIGQKFKLVDHTDKHRFGQVEIRNQIKSTPYKDGETTPIVLKSILKKKRSFLFPSHGITNQLPMNNEGIDEVGGSESKMISYDNKLKHDDGFKASKIDVLATVDQRKMVTSNVNVVKASKDQCAGVENKMMISQIREDNAVEGKSKNNVEIEKASSRSKEIKLARESCKDEDTKRLKLSKTCGRDSRRTSMKGYLMSTSQWMDRVVKNRGDVGVGARGNNFGEWKDGHCEAKIGCNGEERRGGHGKERKRAHDEEWKDHNGEGGSGGYVKKIADSTRGSVKGDTKAKFTPLPSVYYPMTKSGREMETKKKMNEKKEHNMTYDYLDAIEGSFKAPRVNMKTNEGPSFGLNKKVSGKDISHQSDLAEKITKPGEGSVGVKNSEVFWEEYLL